MESTSWLRLFQFGRTRNPEHFLFWFRGQKNRNFGDLVGPYLHERLLGWPAVFGRPGATGEKTVYLTAGSIMKFCDRNAVVWGSGIMFRDEVFARPRRILAVRGPRTRARVLELGFECPEVYGDPGLLLPRLYRPDVERTHDLGVIPHYYDYDAVRRRFRGASGVKVIRVLQPVEAVVRDVLSCARTVSSSLHGVIVSHAYAVPTAWVRFSDRIPGDGVKYVDHFESIGLDGVTAPAEMTGAEVVDAAPQPGAIDTTALWDACPFRAASAPER